MLPEAVEVAAVVGVIGPEVFAGLSTVPPGLSAGLSGSVLGLRAADLGLARAMYIL